MRAFDRVLSTLLALVLVALGVLIPVEVIRALTGATDSLVLPYQAVADFFRDNAWSAGIVIAISAAVALVGLLLLLAEVWPRRPGLYAVTTETDSVTAGVSRRSLSRALGHAVTDVAGINSASASVRRRRAVVDASTVLRDPGDLEQRAQHQADEVMESLALVRHMPVRVRLSQRTED